MMSPGCTALRGTFGRLAYCAAAECGSETPACAHAHIVRPEQSKDEGPAAPNTYGAPTTDCAAAAAVAPAPVAGGGLKVVLPGSPPGLGGGGAGVGAGAGGWRGRLTIGRRLRRRGCGGCGERLLLLLVPGVVVRLGR